MKHILVCFTTVHIKEASWQLHQCCQHCRICCHFQYCLCLQSHLVLTQKWYLHWHQVCLWGIIFLMSLSLSSTEERYEGTHVMVDCWWLIKGKTFFRILSYDMQTECSLLIMCKFSVSKHKINYIYSYFFYTKKIKFSTNIKFRF